MSWLLNGEEYYLAHITEKFVEFEEVKKDLPNLVKIIPELGWILFKIISDYDAHQDGDIEIENMNEFEKESIDRIKDIIDGAKK